MYAFCSAVWSTLVVYMSIMVGTETRKFVCYARGFWVIQERSSIYNVKVTRWPTLQLYLLESKNYFHFPTCTFRALCNYLGSHSTMLHQMCSDVHLEFVNHSWTPVQCCARSTNMFLYKLYIGENPWTSVTKWK